MNFWLKLGVGKGCSFCESGSPGHFVDGRGLCPSCVRRWFPMASDYWFHAWLERQRWPGLLTSGWRAV